jgi:hypothetical protein
MAVEKSFSTTKNTRRPQRKNLAYLVAFVFKLFLDKYQKLKNKKSLHRDFFVGEIGLE